MIYLKEVRRVLKNRDAQLLTLDFLKLNLKDNNTEELIVDSELLCRMFKAQDGFGELIYDVVPAIKLII